MTKLSLLLKVLEDESAETIRGQRTIGAERALPSLHKNIRCGNSLIGRDVLAGRHAHDEEIARINPFDWERGFPAIMAAGGFDAVIGNPPYVRQEMLSVAQGVLQSSDYTTYSGTADLYRYFIEKRRSLLLNETDSSRSSSRTMDCGQYGKRSGSSSRRSGLSEIVDFGDLPVFENVCTISVQFS